MFLVTGLPLVKAFLQERVLTLYDDRLCLKTHKGEECWAWRDITEIRMNKIAHTQMAGMTVMISGYMGIWVKDKEILKIDFTYNKFDRLLMLIQQLHLKGRMILYVEQLKAGKSVQFGQHVILERNSIQNQKDTFFLKGEPTQVSVDGKNIVIAQKSKRMKLSLQNTPNHHILIALLQMLLKST